MLSQEQQQLILDFYFRCGSDDDIARGRDLIAADAEAARLYAGLEETLTELDSIKYEPCPENLADLTVARLKLAASAGRAGQATGQSRLEQLLENERQKSAVKAQLAATQTPPTQRFLHHFFELAAVAAAIVLVSGIVFPTASHMRQKSRLAACTANMAAIGQGMNQFATDREKDLDGVALTAGSPWWKVGDQSQRPQSNTRFAWQLSKGDYVKPEAFICAGHKKAAPVSAQQLFSQLQDFPSRRNISYSFIIITNKSALIQSGPRRIVMGDMNPVFRSIPTCGSMSAEKAAVFEKVLLDNNLRRMCSSNHSCRGQNVLYSDGSVVFAPQREINGDDMFTIHGVDAYTGTESPASFTDTFLVP